MRTVADIITPLVHLNGTDAETLLDQYYEASRALAYAIEVLHGAAPNARDYYPKGPNAFSQAQQAHNARIDKLKEVHEEIREIYESIENQIQARKI